MTVTQTAERAPEKEATAGPLPSTLCAAEGKGERVAGMPNVDMNVDTQRAGRRQREPGASPSSWGWRRAQQEQFRVSDGMRTCRLPPLAPKSRALGGILAVTALQRKKKKLNKQMSKSFQKVNN